jgi:hypothetical protein
MDLFLSLQSTTNQNKLSTIYHCLDHSQGTLKLHPSGDDLPLNLPASVAGARSFGFNRLLLIFFTSNSPRVGNHELAFSSTVAAMNS